MRGANRVNSERFALSYQLSFELHPKSRSQESASSWRSLDDCVSDVLRNLRPEGMAFEDPQLNPHMVRRGSVEQRDCLASFAYARDGS